MRVRRRSLSRSESVAVPPRWQPAATPRPGHSRSRAAVRRAGPAGADSPHRGRHSDRIGRD